MATALLSAVSGALCAQTPDAAQPILEAKLDATEAIPGQSVTLSLTVLVPTWMPQPVVFPTFEMPNLRVRLPDEATSPTSRRVGYDTWSGVTRRLFLTPMVPGVFEIPSQDVVVTFADPSDLSPRKATVRTEPLRLAGVVPAGAEDLDPFIAAKSLELTGEVSGATEGMQPGASATWTVTATLEGSSPIYLPPLLPKVDIAGVAAYTGQPKVEETSGDGELGGTRVETVTFMAESGGSGTLPAIELRWYDLEEGTIRTATTAGFDVSVDAPPAPAPARERDWRFWVAGAATAVGLLLVLLVVHRLAPRLRARAARRREERMASEPWAFDRLRECVHRRDYAATVKGLDLWASRAGAPDPRDDAGVHAALLELGAARYAGSGGEASRGTWHRLDTALAAARSSRRAGVSGSALPPLNPGPLVAGSHRNM